MITTVDILIGVIVPIVLGMMAAALLFRFWPRVSSFAAASGMLIATLAGFFLPVRQRQLRLRRRPDDFYFLVGRRSRNMVGPRGPKSCHRVGALFRDSGFSRRGSCRATRSPDRKTHEPPLDRWDRFVFRGDVRDNDSRFMDERLFHSAVWGGAKVVDGCRARICFDRNLGGRLVA